MFHKLDWQHDLSPLHAALLTNRNEYTESQRYGLAMQDATPSPLVTHVIEGRAKEYVLSLLPEALLNFEVPEVLRLDMDAIDAPNPSLTAHVDYNRKCALNAYIAVNGEVNYYYEWDRQKKVLNETGSFVAQEGDWWLLNTSVPHSVMLVPKKKRSVISVSFKKLKFNKVKELLMGKACKQ